MSAARLIELVNREAAGSERQVVVIVNGEDPITIDAARSINLPIDADGVFIWIGRKAKPGVLDLPDDLKAVVTREQREMWEAPLANLGDTAAPTGDETTFDPGPITNAILNHIAPRSDAPVPDSEAVILDAINATTERLDQIDAELRAAGVDLASLDQADAFPIITSATISVVNHEAGTIEVTASGNATDEDVAAHAAKLNTENPGYTVTPNLTREGLEAMGFKELREIGHGLNVKGTSKAELVRDILAAIAPKA